VAGEFIGRGWTYPARTNASGGIALTSGDAEIAESIRLVLGTSVGERAMRPNFGSRVFEFVFAPVDATTGGRLAAEVRRSLRRWEPRIDVTDVRVRNDPGAPSTLLIFIDYVHKRTNDRRNLVFPFYVIPERE
jgi:phage baseplate assembly protein W